MTQDAELKLTLAFPEPVAVVAARIDERISCPTHARIEVASAVPLHLEHVLEKEASLHVSPSGLPQRTWTLRVGHVDFLRIEEGSLRYVVQLFPAFWLLRFTKDTRKFVDRTAREIVTHVLDKHHVAHRFELTREPEKRKYCVQYHESDLAFVSRLMEFEGIHYAFDDDGTMVFRDRSEDAAPVEGPRSFDLIEAQGALAWETVGLHTLRKGRKVTSGRATVNDFNWKKPKVNLLATASAKEDAELEVYDYPVGYRRTDQGPVLAARRLESYRVDAAYVAGTSNVPSFVPARSFVCEALGLDRFSGDYLLVGVVHEYRNGKFETTAEALTERGITYRNSFHAIPKDVPYRPPLVTPHPHVAGTHTAMVRGPAGEEIHTDVHGRFRAQFHWDREANGSDEDSRWIRNLQETATGMVLARVGWEQTIGYIHGDPDRPLGLGRHINGQMTPEYAQPSNKTRHTMKSPSYPSASGGFNELRLEDLAEAMHMDWHAEKDHVAQIDNDRSDTIARHETKRVGAGHASTVGQDQFIAIGGTHDLNVGGNYKLAVGQDREKTVGGSEFVKVSEVYAYKVVGSEREEVHGNRSVLAAERGGAVTRAVQKHVDRHVLGDWRATGEGNFELLVQDTLRESVGGAKAIVVDNGGIVVKVGGAYELEVGGSVSRSSTSDMGFGAKETVIEVSGDATLESGEKMTLQGDRVELEGARSLTLTSGATTVQLGAKSTSISGKMLIDAKGKIKVTGNPDLLTK